MLGAPAPGAGTGGSPLVVGRYAIYDAIAQGGMATVHLGRLVGAAGFLRTVAIKRLHPQFAADPEFASMLLDEARVAARIQHPNVVPTLDVVVADRELLLVMEYVRGESLSRLVRRARDRGERIPPRVAVSIISGALQGLHAAHEARDEKGKSLDLVHRDVSPQNIMVGVDGTARVLDFGIAKAEGRLHTTKEGEIKGKVLYMPREQLAAEKLTRATDIYSAGIVLFEVLTGVRMFAGEGEVAAITRIINNEVRMPSEIDPELGVFNAVVRRATAASAEARHATAREFALELEAVMAPASIAQVSEWVQALAGDVLDQRERMVAEIERSTTRSKPPIATPGIEMPVIPPPSVPSQSGARLTADMFSPTSDRAPAPSIPLVPSAPSVPSAASQISGAHLAAPPPRRTGLLIALLAFMLLGAIGVIFFLLSRTASVAAPAPVAVTPSAPAASIVSAPVVMPTEKPLASATPSASASATAKPVAAAPPAPKPTATAVVKPKVNCDPPYVVDKQGHRHFIPECVQ